MTATIIMLVLSLVLIAGCSTALVKIDEGPAVFGGIVGIILGALVALCCAIQLMSIEYKVLKYQTIHELASQFVTDHGVGALCEDLDCTALIERWMDTRQRGDK